MSCVISSSSACDLPLLEINADDPDSATATATASVSAVALHAITQSSSMGGKSSDGGNCSFEFHGGIGSRAGNRIAGNRLEVSQNVVSRKCTDGKGNGLFATRAISRDTIVAKFPYKIVL